MKAVISENKKMNLLRKIVGPLVPVECLAKDHSHDF